MHVMHMPQGLPLHTSDPFLFVDPGSIDWPFLPNAQLQLQFQIGPAPRGCLLRLMFQFEAHASHSKSRLSSHNEIRDYFRPLYPWEHALQGGDKPMYSVFHFLIFIPSALKGFLWHFLPC
jgi:hypothetical protein